MCPIGPNSGWNNDRQRRSDAELHAHRLGHVDDAKDFVQYGDDDCPAADAEYPCEKAGDDAGTDDGDGEPGNLPEWHPQIYSAASLIGGAEPEVPAGRSN